MGKRENTVWAAARVLKASVRLRRVRFVSIAFFMLACFALPLQAAAQTTVSITAIKDTAQENSANSNPATFRVSLSQAQVVDVVLTVAYAGGTNNPATPADDLGSDRPTTVTIKQGTDRIDLTVPITDDNIVEGDETFTVTVNTAHSGVTIGSGTATGTIEDNDMARVRLAPRTQTVAENETFNYIVSLSAPVSRVVNITWTASDGTATVMEDLDAPHTNTLTFQPNNNADQIFSIAVNDDDTEEDNETFNVTIMPLGSLPDGVEIGQNRSNSVATITDNDEALDSQNSITTSGSILTIANADPVDEGGTARFEITIEPPISSSSINPTVSYIAGSADLEDLGSARPTGPVQISGGMDSFILEVPIHDDDIAEGDETFTVRLTFGNAGSIQATGTINASDGETSPPPASGDNATVSISNGDELENITGGIMPFTVTLSAAVSRDVVLDVTYAPGETAASPRPPATLADDLGDLPDTITITEGNTEATLMVPVVNDSLVEDVLEVFTVTLEEDEDSPLPEGVTILDGVAVGVIEDNDLASVTLSPETLTAAENESFEYTVSLSAASSKDVNIAWAATAESSDTATVADDLDAPPHRHGEVPGQQQHGSDLQHYRHRRQYR